MKLRMAVSLCACVAAVAMSANAIAAEPFAGGQDGAVRPARAEHPLLRAHLRQRLIEKFDLDKSGRLEEAERASVREAMGLRLKERRAQIRERIDTNDDGSVDQLERRTARERLHARQLRHHAARLERFDGNRDGALSQDERQSARKAISLRMGKFRAQALKRFDADGNGTLNEQERTAAKAATGGKIRRPHGPGQPAN